MFYIGEVIFARKGEKRKNGDIDFYLSKEEYNLLNTIKKTFQIEDIEQLAEIKLEEYYQKLKEIEGVDINTLPQLIATLIKMQLTETVQSGDGSSIVIKDLTPLQLTSRISDAIRGLSSRIERPTPDVGNKTPDSNGRE